MKIATWNVNSLRVRLTQVTNWLNEVKPDVLALQETKLIDADFPISIFSDMGYHAVFSGQRSYNGVAILSRQKPEDEAIIELPGWLDTQKRILGVCVNNIRILNLYVPNGESLLSPKFEYKLKWLAQLNMFLEQELKKFNHYIILGDFNIAPDLIDVHNPVTWAGKVLFSEKERQAFQTILDAGFIDCYRHLNRQQQQYTWWDYRLNAYKRNLGLRIDHILSSQALAQHVYSSHIDQRQRSHERPSDHAPVIAEFRVDT